MPIDREAVLRAAERLLRQGRLDGAIAEYVRLTDDQPRDWNSINTLGDLYVRAGNHERAVAQFVRIADHLFDEGFLPKAAALYKKALKVKHDHEHTLLRLSDIAVLQGLLADAKLYLRQLGQQRQGRGDEMGAAACVVRLGEIDEGDGDAKVAAARAAEAMGDTPRAVMFLQEAAAAFEEQKRASDSADALVAAAQLAPGDAALRASVARVLLSSGQIERAQPFLNPATVAEDPDLLMAVARHHLNTGRTADGYAGLMRAVALAPDRREQVAQLADELLAADRVDAAYGCIDVLVDAALFEGAFERAVQLLESFLARHRIVPGLLKLVDVYVDAGLDDHITTVQGQLADAYLEHGQAEEARIVAEDLVAREPHVDAHVQRLRRALTALGVEDIDAAIARQLDAAPIFDQLLDFSSIDAPAAAPDSPPAIPGVPDLPVERVDREVPVKSVNRPAALDEARHRDTGEIDLSAVLADLKTGATVEARPRPLIQANDDPDPATLLERAHEHLRRGGTREAAVALEAAARVPQLRFQAAAQLGRLALSQGDVQTGIEWLEQAASARSASREDTFGIIYELADVLERAGERVRALAVFMELEGDAGAFRDVRTRIDHLTAGVTGVKGDRT